MSKERIKELEELIKEADKELEKCPENQGMRTFRAAKKYELRDLKIRKLIGLNS